MSERSQANLFESDAAPLMPLLEASHVKTSVLQDLEAVLTPNGAVFGENSTESFANYDHESQLWRTSQRSLLGGWVEFSGTWPRSGMTRNGIAFQRRPLAPITKETGYSLWPTTRKSMGENGVCWKRARSGEGLSNLECFIAWLWLREGNDPISGFHVNPDWIEWFMGFPLGYTDVDAEDLETPLSPT